VFRTGHAIHVPIQGSVGVSLGIFPLIHDEDTLGVVEVLGPTAMVQGRVDVLTALVGQSALVLNSAHLQSEAERALAGMNSLLQLASEFVWAATATEVIRLAVRACHDQVGVPIVGLLPDRDGWGWFVAAGEGVGSRKRATLHASVRTSQGEVDGKRLRLPLLRARFRHAVGGRQVVALRADPAVFLLSDVPDGHDDFLNGIESLVKGVIPRLGRLGSRPSPSEMGIAWTAHELKGPLMGARAALDRATAGTAREEEGRELLRRTKEELGQLSDLIDPLLRWSTGAEVLKRRRVDLVEATREAVASSCLGMPPHRVVVDAPDRLFVRADPLQLKSAIANVVRNALLYSPPDSSVNVRMDFEHRRARLVVSDSGPGIPDEEREAVFGPFQRGGSHGMARTGSGLGLFIARRVLEAHGGSIALRSSKTGASFVLELPEEGWQQSAS
jgi:K+-sensing histidine kinase KdpD